jgi:hypothetical protein
MITTRTVFVAAVALSSACSGGGGSSSSSTGNPPDENVSALTAEIDTARSEAVRHQAAIVKATSLDEVATEIDAHDLDLSAPVNMLSTTMASMTSHCSGSGMGTMHDQLSSLQAEMLSDHDAMVSAASLTAAREETTAHTERVIDILDEMDASIGTMGCTTHR